MVKLYEGGAYLLHGTEVIADAPDALAAVKSKTGIETTKEAAAKETMAYGILSAHNTSGNMQQLQIKFDKLTSHDITFVGIIQTARASGLEKFPIPYVLFSINFMWSATIRAILNVRASSKTLTSSPVCFWIFSSR